MAKSEDSLRYGNFFGNARQEQVANSIEILSSKFLQGFCLFWGKNTAILERLIVLWFMCAILTLFIKKVVL